MLSNGCEVMMRCHSLKLLLDISNDAALGIGSHSPPGAVGLISDDEPEEDGGRGGGGGGGGGASILEQSSLQSLYYIGGS